MGKDKAPVAFQDKKIRRIWYDQEWFYSVVDIVEVLTDSPASRQYWGKVKDREFIALELSPIWVQLKLPAADGKKSQDRALGKYTCIPDVMRTIQFINICP